MIDDPPAGGEAPPGEAVGGDENSPFAPLELQTGGGELIADAPAPRLEGGRLDLVLDVPVKLSVELGRTEVPIREVVNLGRGSIIELDRGPGTPLDVRVNGVLVGRGEVVLVNEETLGLRFVEVVSQNERMKRLS
ncbi:MAG TPA: flagellar motor switch protein FliN [Stellaceae bacterium]|jgi:flagellar motor switch protein FliN/FliY|nr:flagellar motor switch protein FliN [Stellaceae bacterium]